MNKKLRILLSVCSAVMVFTGLAFVNNLVAIFRWWRAFLAAGGDSSQFSASAPGFIGWLNWSAVDYSAVTTLIPFLGSICLVRVLCGLVRGRRYSAADFPFFKGSDQLNVALGLFGTLWGIIVIGYFRLDTVTMGDLMQCLHTALFSTLTAVVWVFMLDRPWLRPYFVRLLQETGREDAAEGDLVAAVELFVRRLDDASAAFAKQQVAFERAFTERQERYEAAFTERQSSYERTFADNLKAFGERQARYEATFDENLKAFGERQARYEATFADNLAAYEQTALKRQEDYRQAFERRLAEYETGFESRQKEYQEFFLRRIDELQKQAEEQRLRADRLAAKLAAVTEALR